MLKIKELRQRLNLSQQQLADATGISRSKIGQWEAGNANPKVTDFETLVGFFSQNLGLNESEIKNLTIVEESKGEAPVKPLRKKANATDKGDLYPEEGERYIRRTNEYVVVEEGNYRLKVKKVDQKAFAGYLAGWADPQYIESLPFTIVTVKEFHSGEYRSFEVSGDSMDYDGKRAIEDGDHVIGRRIEQDLWSSKLHIKQWREWVIVHDEGIVVKHIVKHDVENGIITCRSYNEDKIAYPDFDLHLDDVYELYNVVKVEKNR